MPLRCQKEYPVCGYKYDPNRGDPEHCIPPGTPLREILKSWACDRCVVEPGKVFAERREGN